MVRELNVVDDHPDIDAELMSLFPPVVPTVHPSAERWVGRAQRPGALAALGATAWWLARRPARLASTAVAIVAGHLRRPRELTKALATLPLAAAHARTLREHGVDRVHAHFATWPALAAWVGMRLTDVPYSFTAHAHDIYLDRTFLDRKSRDADFVVTISEFNRRLLAPHAGDTPIHLVHCGIDPAAYGFRDGRLPASGPVRALCVASLQEYKGHEVLLRALRDEPRLELDLVGAGELREPLEALARELGVDGRVRFLGGLPENEVASLLDRAALFVLPSLVARSGQMDGLPVALMEALAAGVPTVSTRLSGIPELVRDGETGLLAEPGDAASLRDAIARTLADPAAAGRRAAAGRALVEREFDIRATGGRMAELLLQAR